MQNFSAFFLHLLSSSNIFLDKICRPNPKYFKNALDEEMAHKRNKMLITIHISLILAYIFESVLSKGSLRANLVLIIYAILVIAGVLLFCYHHPQIFKCYYTAITLSYGPYRLESLDGACSSFMGAHVLPIFVHQMTGSFWHFIFQSIAQNYFINTIYKDQMEKFLASTPRGELLKNLTRSSNLALIIGTILIILMDLSLRRAHDQAIASEKMRNEAENQKTFLMSFSHEIRNLINSLTGNVQLASLENITGRTKELLRNAEVCGELLLHLINNILDTGKTQIGELDFNPTSTNTYEAFEKIWSICSELIRRKDLKGTLKIQKNVPQTLMIDLHRMTQIFLNLVGNALKFTEEGFINITVQWLDWKREVDQKCFEPYPFNKDDQDEGLFEKQQSFTVLNQDFIVLTTTNKYINRVKLKQSNEMERGILKIIVSDSGCGMTKEQTEKLFQKFTQVTPDMSKRKLGSGLGLYITKQLCLKMQGEVKVFSEKDKGSSFIMCIPSQPVREDNKNFNDLEHKESFLPNKKLTAMIVDDTPFSHIVLKSFFEKLGIEVIEIAVNGIEAYQKYTDLITRGDPPDIVTMDLDMPIMNGKEASRKIRELERINKSKPCFLLLNSGNFNEHEIEECIDKGGPIRADIFLEKPIKANDLLEVVTSHFIPA